MKRYKDNRTYILRNSLRMSGVSYESFYEWLEDNYSATLELWEMCHKNMKCVGLVRSEDIDYEREYFTRFAHMIYRKNRMTL